HTLVLRTGSPTAPRGTGSICARSTFEPERWSGDSVRPDAGYSKGFAADRRGRPCFEDQYLVRARHAACKKHDLGAFCTGTIVSGRRDEATFRMGHAEFECVERQSGCRADADWNPVIGPHEQRAFRHHERDRTG